MRTGFDARLDGMRRVQLRPAVIAPVGQARSDIGIVMALADRLGLDDAFFDGDVDAGYEHILAGSGVTVQSLRDQPEGVTLPTTVPLRNFESENAAGNPVGFPTPTKKIEIYSEQLHRHGQ